MALLTAEDVLNKAFSKTKYREGFDQDEVDDFLDEVAHTVSSLMAERDDLAARLEAAQAQLAQAAAAPAAAPNSSFGAPAAAYAQAATESVPESAPQSTDLASDWQPPASVESTPVEEVPAAHVEPAPEPEPEPTPAQPEVADSAADAASSPTAMLAMAQKLHDEYVSSGLEEKERILTEAREQAGEIIAQAEAEAQSKTQELVSERTDLESKIDDLRRFERDYRSRLTTYLENLLGDLDHGAGRDDTPREPATL